MINLQVLAAEQALRSLIARDPAHAESHHNLGTQFMRCRRHDEAVAAYRQSLRYRPNYVPTYEGLACRPQGKRPVGGSRVCLGASGGGGKDGSRGAGKTRRLTLVRVRG